MTVREVDTVYAEPMMRAMARGIRIRQTPGWSDSRATWEGNGKFSSFAYFTLTLRRHAR